MAKGDDKEVTRRRKGAKIEDKRHNQSNKSKIKKKKNHPSNGAADGGKKDEPEVIVVSQSENDEGNEEVEIVHDEDSVGEDNGNDGEEENEEVEEQEDAKSSDITNQRSNKVKNVDEKEKEDVTTKKKKTTKIAKSENNEMAASHCFPMHRISRIIKSEDSEIRIAQEAVFLINKASEKFLELFCEEAYACAFLEHKNHVSYKHLSMLSNKRNFYYADSPLNFQYVLYNALKARICALKFLTSPNSTLRSSVESLQSFTERTGLLTQVVRASIAKTPYATASIVSKRKRFDFLSDFVPEKVKAEDALAEMSVAET